MSKRKKKAKMGRPPIPPSERRSAVITIRLRKDERKMLEREAKKEGLSFSSYLLKCWREKREKGG
jgi:uncharacterized protein (DUF1778 family)